MILFNGREARSRSFLKAVSWRITGSIDTLLVSFFVTGKWNVAASIAFVEVITKVVLYYFHERAWVMFGWGTRS